MTTGNHKVTCGRGVAIVLTLVLVALSTLVLGAAGASARLLVPHSFSAFFQGETSTAGAFGNKISSVAADEVTGDVYVLRTDFVIDKFDAAGNPAAFTLPSLEGASSLTILSDSENFARNMHIVVDNSSTSTQGRIYVVIAGFGGVAGQTIFAFNPSGAAVGGNYPLHVFALSGMSIDPTTGDIWMGVAGGFSGASTKYTSAGVSTGEELPPEEREGSGFKEPIGGGSTGVDSDGHVYLGQALPGFTGLEKYDQDHNLEYELPLSPFNSDFPNFTIDPNTNDLYALTSTKVDQYGDTGELLASIGSGSMTNANSVAVNGTNGNVYVSRAGNTKRVDIYAPGPPVTVPDVRTDPGSEFKPTSVKLNGGLNPDGETTTGCRFEWSKDRSFSNSTPCEEGDTLSGSSEQAVSAVPTGLDQGDTYNYRLVGTNANGSVFARDLTFVPSDVPAFDEQWATDVHADSVRLHAEITPEGAPTTFRFQYGPEDCSVSACSESSAGDAGSALTSEGQSLFVDGLEAGTTYHYRVVGINQSGTSYGSDHTFTTFPYTQILDDPCPNAHVRQQVSAALLPDCRAYELVSAEDTGGYNVESDLVADQQPFGGYPEAQGRALYGVHSGAIPGPWNPANRGVDTYLATRGETGWTTDYVGIPADNPYASAPFASELDEANAFLTNFAFGGEDICHPCFADGSTGIPLREDNGEFVQGMAGPEYSGSSATSDGLVRQRFSADGNHFVFGSTTKFAAGGNDETGDVSIYDRNLQTGQTQLVSTDPSGEGLDCLQGVGQCHSPSDKAGIAELAVSSDGSRIVLGQLIGTDTEGNHQFHLYMHVGTDPETIDLTPGTTTGARFDGMTDDGTMVYFSTKDPLTTAADPDTDSSADIFRADVSTSSTDLTRVSVGESGTGDTDFCEPPGEWNDPSGPGKCSALAFAGGAGVAPEEGSIYFLSPERLDTSNSENEPVQDQANLYVAKPGSAPHFVATMDTSVGKPPPLPPTHHLLDKEFITGLEHPESIAVDESNGDIYVAEQESGSVSRFTSAGAPAPFSGIVGEPNKITGQSLGAGIGEAQIGIDNAPSSPFKGDLYVSNINTVAIFAPNGEKLGSVGEGFVYACGVAVDPSNGAVYVGDLENIWRYMPVSGASAPITEADYEKTGIYHGGFACQVGADGIGNVYMSEYFEGPTKRFAASSFGAGPPAVTGELVQDAGTKTTYTDPVTNELYVATFSSIFQRTPTGTLIDEFGDGEIEGAYGVAVNGSTKHVYAVNYAESGWSIAEFDGEATPFHPIDNTAIRNAVTQAGIHSYGDFQVTADGHYAAFASTTPFTAYDNDGKYEVFRYDSQGDSLACASCNPTGARAVGSSILASLGLGLTEEGRLFFNSNDAIAPRDLDNRQDAYEWDGTTSPEQTPPQLISTGQSAFNSSLLGVSRDGKDAFFFTRDTLVPQDQNGSRVKLYDAREEGGFSFLPAPVPCKASDECHGSGSAAPGPLPIDTINGTGGNNEKGRSAGRKRCRKDFRQKGKRCVRKKHHHHKRGHRSHTTNHRGH